MADGATQARRRKQSLIARVLQQIANLGLSLFGNKRIDVLLREGQAPEGRRLGGKRLRRRGPLAGNVGLRNGALLDGPERLASDAVEDEQETELGGLRDSVHS